MEENTFPFLNDLDAALARGITELDAGQRLDAEEVRKELRKQLGASQVEPGGIEPPFHKSY